MRRTKIVCTLGPASESPAVLQRLVKLGMDAARLNFSHNIQVSHRRLIKEVRKTDARVPIIADLQGPKIRVGALPAGGVTLKKNQFVVFSLQIKNGAILLPHQEVFTKVKKGERLLLNDGNLEVKVISVGKGSLKAQVVQAGRLLSHQGVNLPDTNLVMAALTAKDRADLVFAVRQGVDYIALSFVKDAADITVARALIKKAVKKGQVAPRILVKIERAEAIKNFDAILAAADAVMVARGDLALEIQIEEVPIQQIRLIDKCRLAGKPVIVATEMLQSMTQHVRPTRAEVSDVANAVFDHTDAVMLSAETASGLHPLEAVRLMDKVIREAEASPYDDVPEMFDAPAERVRAIAYSLRVFAVEEHFDGILSAAAFAPWIEKINMAHPEIPFFLAASSETVARQLNLKWAVCPLVLKTIKQSTFVKSAVAKLKEQDLIKNRARLLVVMSDKKGVRFEVAEG